MVYRDFCNSKVSLISLGTWQLGGKWGEKFNKEEALKILETAYTNGINCFDTADIYQSGLSEKTIGEFIKDKKDKIFVITKCGRKANPHTIDSYNKDNILKYINSSIENLGKPLDLILLHCPPSEVYENKELFSYLDYLKEIGLIKNYGVSVEKVSEALKALEYNISAIEIIYNMFRLKPEEELFAKAEAKGVGIIVRVPLASGLLTGKYNRDTKFGLNDHRTYNRNGESFDKGETFSGVDYELGLKAVEELKAYFGDNLVVPALAFCYQNSAVSTVIPGASNHMQVLENIKAIDYKFSTKDLDKVKEVYNKYIRESVHKLW